MPKTNLGKKYRDRQNDKRRIVYWLEAHNLGWVAKVVRKTNVKGK